MDSIWFLLLLQIVLIALNAIFASAEIAVLSINEAKLEKMANDGNRKAKRLVKLTSEPARFLATIQVAITLSGFLGSAFAADNFSEPLVDWVLRSGVNISRATLDAVAVILITLVLSYFTLIFGELVPKRLAMKRSEKIAMGISGLVSGVSVICKPVVWFLSVSTNLVLRLFHIDPNEADEQVSEEEIRMLVDAGSEKGTIDIQEKEFIQNVFEFNDITAEEIAVHRTEVIFLSVHDSPQVWDAVICDQGHTLYPVFDGTADNIIGVLNAKKYFALKDKSRENIMEHAVQEAYFVPEKIKADVLFRNMKKTRNAMAVVIDEYGGMQGIVTMHDLVEELVGDINEEQPDPADPEPYIEAVGEGMWKITGNVSLEEVEAVTGIPLQREEYDTLTGWVFNALGTVLADGEHALSLNIENMTIQIQTVKGHQVEAAVIRRKTSEASE